MGEDEGDFRATPLWHAVARGETPIFYAARLQRLKALDLLIAAGADPTIRDPQNRDAADIARARHLPQAVIARLAAKRGGA
jgi:ankyrin repeat protein